MKHPNTFSFRFFPSREVAEEVQLLLNSNGIDSVIKEDTGDLAKEFLGDSPHHKFELLIAETDRDQAEAVLLNRAMEELDDIDKSHFLFDYTNEELMTILIEKDEWNEVDVLLSQKILQERGVVVQEEELQVLREKRLNELAKPESKQTGWVIFGYIAIVIAPFVGAILGFALSKSQKRLPNGVKVPRYSTSIQKHGDFIGFTSVISLVLQIYLRSGLTSYLF